MSSTEMVRSEAARPVVRSPELQGLNSFEGATAPAAAFPVASQLFIDAAATPPFQGGEWRGPHLYAIRSRLHRPLVR